MYDNFIVLIETGAVDFSHFTRCYLGVSLSSHFVFTTNVSCFCANCINFCPFPLVMSCNVEFSVASSLLISFRFCDKICY